MPGCVGAVGTEGGGGEQEICRVLAAQGTGQKWLFGKVTSVCNCQGLIRVGTQMAGREVGGSSCEGPLKWKKSTL